MKHIERCENILQKNIWLFDILYFEYSDDLMITKDKNIHLHLFDEHANVNFFMQKRSINIEHVNLINLHRRKVVAVKKRTSLVENMLYLFA